MTYNYEGHTAFYKFTLDKTTLTRRIAELTQEIDAATERSADVKRFVALVRKYTAIEELTYENVHELITCTDYIIPRTAAKVTNKI